MTSMIAKVVFGTLIGAAVAAALLGDAEAATDCATLTDAEFNKTVNVKYVVNTPQGTIHEVPLLEYLMKVVHPECGSIVYAPNPAIANFTNAEKTVAYKCSAIAAATFLKCNMPRGENYDITDSPSEDHAYNPAANLQDFEGLISTAVDALYALNEEETKYVGKVVTYNSVVIDALYYGKNSSGLSANSEDEMSAYLPYCREKYTSGIGDPGDCTDGHGVGMSQAGMRFLASEGNSYESILVYYYQPVPPVLLHVKVIQDIDGDKDFADGPAGAEIVYDGKWTRDDAPLTDRNKRTWSLTRKEDGTPVFTVSAKYYTKFILYFNEKVTDFTESGQQEACRLKVILGDYGDNLVSVYRLKDDGTYDDNLVASDGVPWGARNNATGVLANNISGYDRRVAVAVLAPKTMKTKLKGDIIFNS